MPSSYSPALRLVLPADGELLGTWGSTLNTGMTALAEQAIAGRAGVVMTDADYTLTALNGVADEARNMVLHITGTLTAARNVICPAQAKLYVLENASTGGFALTLKTAAGTGVSVPAGSSCPVRCDGTNVVVWFGYLPAITLGTANITTLVVPGGNTDNTWQANLGSLTVVSNATVGYPSFGYNHASGNAGSTWRFAGVDNATWIQYASSGISLYGNSNAPSAGGLITKVLLAGFARTGAITIPGTLASGDHTVTGALSATGTISNPSMSLSGLAPANSMTLDASGNLNLGVTGAPNHALRKPVVQATKILEVSAYPTAGNDTATFWAVDAFTPNAASAAIKVGTNSVTGRSVTAGGTVLGGGADYAEYEHNNSLTIAKGSIVGFKADGTLTATFAEAIRFAIKSTNPSFVGGDTWGSEDKVGKRPEEPQFTPAPYTGTQAPTEPTVPGSSFHTVDGVEVADYVSAEETAAYDAAKASYDAALHVYVMDMAQYAASVVVAKGLFDTATYPEYLRATAVFEAALEVERQKVDRIAYSGKVPCNVTGAVAGGYIIAVDNAGSITGEFVADPDFAQYKKAVGRVNCILPDGRCEVAVIIH